MQRKPIPWLVLLSALPFMVGLALAGSRSDVFASAPLPATQHAGQTPSPTPACGPAWRLVTSPNPDPIHNSLWGVDALSPDYAWAVGNFFDTGSNRFESLITRWDGAQWSAVPSPNVGFGFNYLEDVAAISANDAWAAGYWFGTGPPQTFIQRWNGTQWAIVPSPNTSSSDNLLLGLAAVAADNVWAVGYYAEGTTYRTLIQRWNGTEWSIVPSPNGAGASSYLQGVAAISANDVWAVGYTGTDGAWQTLAMHWDGAQWSVVSTPNIGTEDDQLQAVTAVASNEVWAVGKSLANGVYRTLTMRWNGSQWAIVPSPSVDGGSSFLLDVDASDGGNVWAVGHSLQSEISPYRTLTMRWDGSQWSIVPSANFGTDNNTLAAVAVAQAHDVWAVGNSVGDFFQTLIERYHDPCGATGTPTATQTMTPVPTSTVTSTPTRIPTVCGSWTVVPSPNQPGYLHNVDAVSHDDVWAVGEYFTSDGVSQSLAMHWNGIQWRVIPSPNPTVYQARFVDVAAISSDNVWAVGWHCPAGQCRTFVSHWDGTAWSIVPSPNANSEHNFLYSVAAVSASDVWAAGFYKTDSGLVARTLIMHWDGLSWSIVPSPNAKGARFSHLRSIAAIAANDIWAVGFTSSPDTLTLTLHWDGTQWSLVPSPNGSSTGSNELLAVSATSSNDVWAVGGLLQTGSLILHWNGSQWSVVPTFHRRLHAVVALAPNDVWAVGWRNLHWDGVRWTSVPGGTESGADLRGIEALSSNDIWAVGFTGPPYETIVEHFSELPFTDVHPTDYFYEAVRYLFCNGVISGYADNTFRPYNNTTRGQLTKIVVLAEGWPIYTPPTPTFSDVPTTDPFYEYVETAYYRGIISGYSDGTFRPGNNVTRGQLCKIVVLAEGWPLINPPNPTFIDVPTNHAFYTYIETAFNNSIISGYSDGSFRPGNSATRGQISKIVYLAVRGVCGTVPPSPNVQITPSNCEPAGTSFTFVASGFAPGESVGVYVTDPEGAVFGAPFQVTANSQGITEPVSFNILPNYLTGRWYMTFEGVSSGFRAVGYFMLRAP